MTKRKRKRRKSLVENIRRRLVAKNPEPARASDYIFHLQEILDVTKKFILLPATRVSTQQQEKDGSLRRQKIRLFEAIIEDGGRPYAPFRGRY